MPGFYVEMTGRGLKAKPPAETRYGYLAFEARDPDGHGLFFHEPLPGTPEAVAREAAKASA